MKRQNVIIALILGAIAIGVSFLLDDFVASLLAPIVGTTSLPNYAQVSIVLLPLFIIILYAIKRGRQKAAQLILVQLVVTALIQLLKVIIDRARPETALEIGGSFPSNHAALSFVAIPFAFELNKKFGIAWVVYAMLVSFSRLILGVHYFSDVVAGSIIGFTIGLTAYVWWKKQA